MTDKIKFNPQKHMLIARQTAEQVQGHLHLERFNCTHCGKSLSGQDLVIFEKIERKLSCAECIEGDERGTTNKH